MYILWGMTGLDNDKIGRVDISKIIVAVQARDDDGGGGAE